MSYKKPQIVAKSAPKQSFVAGCPTNSYCQSGCSCWNSSCMMGELK